MYSWMSRQLSLDYFDTEKQTGWMQIHDGHRDNTHYSESVFRCDRVRLNFYADCRNLALRKQPLFPLWAGCHSHCCSSNCRVDQRAKPQQQLSSCCTNMSLSPHAVSMPHSRWETSNSLYFHACQVFQTLFLSSPTVLQTKVNLKLELQLGHCCVYSL